VVGILTCAQKPIVSQFNIVRGTKKEEKTVTKTPKTILLKEVTTVNVRGISPGETERLRRGGVVYSARQKVPVYFEALYLS